MLKYSIVTKVKDNVPRSKVKITCTTLYVVARYSILKKTQVEYWWRQTCQGQGHNTKFKGKGCHAAHTYMAVLLCQYSKVCN